MSTINIILDLHEKNWTIDETCLTSSQCLLQFGFKSNISNVLFDNLSFGFILLKSGKEIQNEKYPSAGIVYRSSSQLYLISTRLDLEPSTTYKISAWAENGGLKSSVEKEFHVPALTNTGEYENSSVPFPDPTNNYSDYYFDDVLRQWIKK